MKVRITIILLSLLFTVPGFSQPSSTVFSFLEFSPSARLTALAQYGTALYGKDPALSFSNPANLHSELDLTAGFQHAFLNPGAQIGRAYLADKWKKYDLQVIGAMSYSSNGEIKRADQLGNVTGTFEANSLTLYGGVSKALYERLQVGLALEYLQSNLAEYQSNGLVTHLGLLYNLEEKMLTVGMSWKNIGWQWSPYYTETEDIRSDLQIAISKRLAHLPFRFSFIYHDLNRWNLLYESPVDEENILIINEEETDNPVGMFFNNFARHLAVNGEFFIGKKENLRLRLGYDHERRQELTISNWNSLAGFSFGAGVNIKGIIIDYGFASYHIGGGINHLGLTIKWDQLIGPGIL